MPTENEQTRKPWARPRLEKLELAQTAGLNPGVAEGGLGNYT